MRPIKRPTRTWLRMLCGLGLVAGSLAVAPGVPAQVIPQAPQGPPPAATTPAELRPPTEEALPPYDGVPDGYMIIEGDIIVPSDFYLRSPLSPEGAWTTSFWPSGNVPYVFDANVSAANQTAMLAAMAEWENIAHVDFFVRSSQANYIHIRDSDENSSMVGMVGGRQYVNIYNWNYRFIMAHELGHALGLWHEQSRPNRDTYVQIEWDCIQDGYSHNFDKETGAGQYPRNGYDFDSVMHYGQSSFFTPATSYCAGINRTITVLAPNQSWQTQIGQRNHLSTMDQYTMMFLYPETNWRFADIGYTGGTENGTFLYPYKQFPTGFSNTPVGGTLWVQPGTYSSAGTYNRAVTIRAPLGGVVLR